MKALIRRFASSPDWNQVETLSVDLAPWGGDYRPRVTARLALIEGAGFAALMECEESEPKAVYEGPDQPVCKDSCMEWFVNFYPQRSGAYINLECNARGALHAGYGEGRHGRRYLREMGVPMPTVSATSGRTLWRIEYFVPLRAIEALYGQSRFDIGDQIKANFYKCGDETDCEHYLCWAPVSAPGPDFHRPECFGELIIQ